MCFAVRFFITGYDLVADNRGVQDTSPRNGLSHGQPHCGDNAHPHHGVKRCRFTIHLEGKRSQGDIPNQTIGDDDQFRHGREVQGRSCEKRLKQRFTRLAPIGRGKLLFIERIVAIVIADVAQEFAYITSKCRGGPTIPNRRTLVGQQETHKAVGCFVKHDNRLAGLETSLQIVDGNHRGKLKFAGDATQAHSRHQDFALIEIAGPFTPKSIERFGAGLVDGCFPLIAKLLMQGFAFLREISILGMPEQKIVAQTPRIGGQPILGEFERIADRSKPATEFQRIKKAVTFGEISDFDRSGLFLAFPQCGDPTVIRIFEWCLQQGERIKRAVGPIARARIL